VIPRAGDAKASDGVGIFFGTSHFSGGIEGVGDRLFHVALESRDKRGGDESVVHTQETMSH
jgi:hypothetical protein